MYKKALSIGIVLAGLGVILGAMAAHKIKEVAGPELAQTFKTGVEYQMYHSFAMILVAILYASFPNKQLKFAATFFLVGILLFSGSLYALTLLKMNGEVGLSGVGIITPIGGLFFIGGWLMMLLGVMKKS
jgi:uncharacterized membrane protein YgdD (TMEM256/DUF423 family)